MDDADNYGSGERTQNQPEAEGTVKSAAQDVTQDARRRGQEVISKVANEAQGIAGHFRDQAGSAFGEGKTQLVAQIGGVARAFKASSAQLREDDLAGLASFSDTLAGQVEAVHTYLDERSSEDLLTDVQTFARRRRGLFIGSLIAAGLIAVRFARSSAPAPERGAPVRPVTVRPATVVSRGGVRTYPRGRS